MIRFDFLNIDKRITFKPGLKEQLARIPKDFRKKLGEITVVFTNNDTILEINKSYLNHTYFTDVITFDAGKKSTLEGDIFISVEQVRINAVEFNVDFQTELLRVIVHGFLHLAGCDDRTSDEKIAMRKKEDQYLCRFIQDDITDEIGN